MRILFVLRCRYGGDENFLVQHACAKLGPLERFPSHVSEWRPGDHLCFFLHSCSGGKQTPHRLTSRATSLSLPKKSCARRLGLFLANGRLAAAAWSYRAEINELLTAFSVHPVFGYAARPLRLNERFLVARFFWGDELSLQCHLKLWRTSICRWWRISREIMTCRGSRLCYGVISLWPCFRCLQAGFVRL